MSMWRITTVSNVPGYVGVPSTKLFRSYKAASETWAQINKDRSMYLSAVFVDLHSFIGESFQTNILAWYVNARLDEFNEAQRI